MEVTNPQMWFLPNPSLPIVLPGLFVLHAHNHYKLINSTFSINIWPATKQLEIVQTVDAAKQKSKPVSRILG